MSLSKILCAFGILIVSSVAFAQDITDVEARPYASYTGSSIDTVDLLTGNLMLHIPIISYPQKGTLPPLSFSVELNNAPYALAGGCDGSCTSAYMRYDTSPPGAAYIFPIPAGQGYQYQNVGAYITSSFAGGIVTGQSQTAASGAGPVLVYNLIDPDGTTHELESDYPSLPNTYRTPDGSGYTFLPGDTQSGNAYDLYNADNLGMGSAGSSYAQATNYWVFVPQDNSNPFEFTSGSGVRLGTILTPTGIKYSSSTLNNIFPISPSEQVFPTGETACTALTTTATDPTGNTITRSLWYWSGCASKGSFADIAADYAGFSHPVGYPAGPYYVDSVNRVIPDILSTEATISAETMNSQSYSVPWNVPGPGGNTLNYVLHYTQIFNWDYNDQQNCAPTCAQTWNGPYPDPSVAFYGNNDANGFALSSVTLPSSPSSTTGQWQFIYSPQELGQTVAGDPNFYYCSNNCASATGPDLLTVITPTGGEIDYTYQTIEDNEAIVALSRCGGVNCHAVRARIVRDNNGGSYTTTYTYGTYTSSTSSSQITSVCPTADSVMYAVWTKETDSLGNDTVHSFCGSLGDYKPTGAGQYHEIETQYFQGSTSLTPGTNGFTSGSLLKTVTTTWAGGSPQVDIQPPAGGPVTINVLPTQIVTTMASGGSTTEVKGYSSLFSSGRAYCGASGCGTNTPVWWPSAVYPYPQDFSVDYLSPTSDAIYSGSSPTTGTLLRNTTTQFEFQNSLGSAYATANMIGLPLMEQNLDANNNVLSQTTYCYDSNSNCGSNQQNLDSGEPYCGNSAYPQPCGDLTATARLLNPSTNVTTTTTYVQGMPVLKTDANGNQTKITYQCQGMYPLTVTKAFGSTTTLQQTTRYTYDCATANPQNSSGVVTGVTDPNGVQTNYIYTDLGGMPDPLGRLRQVQYGVVSTSNGSTAQSTATLSYPSLTEVDISQEQSGPTNLTGGIYLNSKTVYDGLGRTIQQTNPAQYNVLTSYSDDSSRPFTVTNPISTDPNNPSTATDGKTIYAYDALGRVVQKTNPVLVEGQPGTTQWWCYDSVPDASLSPSNNQPTSSGTQLCSVSGTGNSWVNSMDESGNPHQQSYDSLGQLIAVTEPNTATGSMTTNALGTAYTYDGLGNLTKVVQSGLSPESARVRTFTYDSLSRLICAANPENSSLSTSCPTTATSTYTAGTTGYAYDLNGNLSSKTDARGITVSYAYDALNRLLSKTYATTSKTPASCYQYDQAPSSLSNVNFTNPIGHLTAEWTQTGACPTPVQLPASGTLTSRLLLNYDFMGRLKGEQQCTSSTCSTPYNFSYTYDAAGHLASANNGMGTISWLPQYDGAGRLSSVTGNASWMDPQFPSNLFNSQSYGAAGITSWVMPGLTFTKNYDTRLRVTSEAVTGNQPTQ